ncbi:MAG: HAD-IA family hydrolase [Eubacteriales bacterium]|nr:HAD-IA family hydrolase [Eubacteriales bacterium]
MIDTLVFDFDGTLMDTNNVIIQSWQHTYRTLTGHEGDLNYILSTFGEPLELSLKNAFPDVISEESVNIYRTWHKENYFDMIKLFPGITEMLQEAKDRGYKLGIATSRVEATLYQGLEKYDLTDMFDEIVTIEEVKKHKPDPECLFRVLEKINSLPQSAAMIGDSRLDMMCARNAGTKAILVGWSLSLAGKKIQDFPEVEVPDHIIETPMELFETF